MLVAALLGTGFPLIAHFAIPPDDRAGSRLSYLYVGNILGSALGSLLTGFVKLDRLPLRALAPVLAVGGVIASGSLAIVPMPPGRRRRAAIAAVGLAIGLVVASAPPLARSRTSIAWT